MLHVFDHPRRPVSASPIIPPEKPKRYYMSLSWSLNDISVKEKRLVEFFSKNDDINKKKMLNDKILEAKSTIEDDFDNILIEPNKFQNMSATTKRSIWRGIPFYGSDSTTSHSGSTCRTTTDSSMCSCSTSPYSSISLHHKHSFFSIKNPFSQIRRNKNLQRSKQLINAYSDASYKSVNSLNSIYHDDVTLRSRDFSLPEKDTATRKRSKSKGIESKILCPLKNSARKISNALHLRPLKKSYENISQGSSPLPLQTSVPPNNYTNSSFLDVDFNIDELNYYSHPSSPNPSPNLYHQGSKNLDAPKMTKSENQKKVFEYSEGSPYSEEFIKKELKKNLEKHKSVVRRKSCDPILDSKPFDNYLNNDFRERMIV
uniref:Protein BIG GRAIN 1-like B n=1 Tax=Strongyloides papillosus TaxID=174720 RepID=A0A0N5CGQ2_STREA